MYIGKTRKYLSYRLNKDMERGRLTNLDGIPRRIGKTTLIAKLAKDNGLVVVEPTLNHLKYFKQAFPYVPCINARAIGAGDHRAFILDEGISIKEEKHLRKHFNVVGGFSGNGNTPWGYIKDGSIKLIDSVAYAKHNFDKAVENTVNTFGKFE